MGIEEKSANVKTTLQSIACGGTGGELTAVDSVDGKIVRIRGRAAAAAAAAAIEMDVSPSAR